MKPCLTKSVPLDPKRAFVWLAVAFATLFLVIEAYRSVRYPGLNWDNYRQLAAAQNLLDGEGLTLARYEPAGARRVTQKTVTQWAFGYPVAIAGLQKALGTPFRVVAALSLLGTIGFLVFWIGWMGTLLPEMGIRLAAAGLAWGLLGATPLQWLPAVDRLTWVAFLGCSLFVYRLSAGLTRNKSWEWAAAIALAGLTAALRYAYWPAVAAFAVLALSRLDRRWSLVRVTVSALAAAALAWGALYVRQKGPDGALHWKNWTKFFPFPVSAFGAPTHLGAFLESPWAWLTGLALAALVFRKKGWDRHWLALSAAGIAVPIALLLGASLVLAAGKASTLRITPIGEARYFAPAVGLFMILWLVKAGRGAIPAIGLALPFVSALVGFSQRYAEWDSLHLPYPVPPPLHQHAFAAIRGNVRADRVKGKRVYWIQDSPSEATNLGVAAGAVWVPEPHAASFGKSPPEGAVLYYDRQAGRERATPVPMDGHSPPVLVWRNEQIEIFRVALSAGAESDYTGTNFSTPTN